MFKVTRKVGITIALSALVICAGAALTISAYNSNDPNSEFKSDVEACREAGKIVLSGHLLNLIGFEYQVLSGDIYRHRRVYTKAQTNYAEAAQIAQKNFASKSFFTYLAYECKAHAEQKSGKKLEAYQDFRAALHALPELAAYEPYRWTTERWVISLGGAPNRESIQFYQAHLALAEKLSGGVVDKIQLITAIWEVAQALDANGAYDWSETYWKRMTEAVRAEHYAPTKFLPFLLNLANHEIDARHYVEADKTLAEALNIANEAHDDKLIEIVLLKKGELKTKENDLSGAQEALQKYLEIAKKSNDVASQSTALGYLSEVARKRGDLASREALLLQSMELAQTPSLKPRYLFVLACIAARRKEYSKTTDYCSQWKKLTQITAPDTSYLAEYELNDLIVLYPGLKKFEKLPVGVDGVTFNAEQTAKLLTIISVPASHK